MSEAGKKKRILIIDDDPALRRLLKFGLEKAGYETLTADHGGDAVALVGRETVDLMLVDLMMPVLDGLRLLRWLREESRLDVPALVFTSFDRKNLAEEVRATRRHRYHAQAGASARTPGPRGAACPAIEHARIDLPIFPQGALSASVITTVWVGVWVVAFFNLRLGWTFSGLVVPGYMVPVFIAKPWCGGILIVEGILTYLIVYVASERLSAAPASGRASSAAIGISPCS